jgi:hypothetical protein
MAVMDIALNVFAERLPRELGYPGERSKPVRLIDAMNDTIDIPIDLCSTRSVRTVPFSEVPDTDIVLLEHSRFS